MIQYSSLLFCGCQETGSPVRVCIERIYQKRFGKARPDRVLSIEERAREVAAKKAMRRERRGGNVPHDKVKDGASQVVPDRDASR